jgi:hypothetical protein
MSEGRSGEYGVIGTVFLAWLLTYFIKGPPHWLQAMLFWLWLIPLIIVLVLAFIIAVIAAAS